MAVMRSVSASNGRSRDDSGEGPVGEEGEEEEGEEEEEEGEEEEEEEGACAT